MFSNSQKLKKKKKKKKKKQLFTKRMILEFISENQRLITFQYPKNQLGILLDFSN